MSANIVFSFVVWTGGKDGAMMMMMMMIMMIIMMMRRIIIIRINNKVAINLRRNDLIIISYEKTYLTTTGIHLS